MRARIGAFLAATLAASLGMSVGANSVAAGSARAPIVGLRHSTSSNWGGYAAYGAPVAFSSVTATWVQPAPTCTSKSTYSAYWVGLDGYNTSTVEQLGTEADCSGGAPTYYAWYEMYPHAGYYINTVTVKSGHSYTASVTYQGGRFVLTLNDNTAHTSFITSQKSGSAKRASAEVIVEAPWSGGVLPLANFGTANFSGAMANGRALGGFSPLDPITMDNPNGTATPSKFDLTSQAFSIAYSS